MNEEKRVVNIAPIKAALKTILEFNRLELSEIELPDHDKPIMVSEKILKRWKIVGLNSSHFVDMEMWRPENWVGHGDMT